MKEQKFLRNLSLLISIATLIIAIIVEFLPSEYVTINCLKGHRNFGVSLFLGIFSGAIVSFFTTGMLFCIQKAKTVNNLINDLVSIKRCVYEIENNIGLMSRKSQELGEVCCKILDSPDNWDLEGEIVLEKDFIGAIKDIQRSCMSETWFDDKKFLVGEYIDRFVLNILMQCHVQSEQFSNLLKYYDIKQDQIKG